ncbi:MAG: hypothetical protein H0W02_09890 [Ktedonobacteraceae bacterium]|nr:hypothetical protein [Ktedonobacteraceae bacterium]
MYKQTTEKSLKAETQDMYASGEHEKKMEKLERKVGTWKKWQCKHRNVESAKTVSLASNTQWLSF